MEKAATAVDFYFVPLYILVGAIGGWGVNPVIIAAISQACCFNCSNLSVIRQLGLSVQSEASHGIAAWHCMYKGRILHSDPRCYPCMMRLSSRHPPCKKL